MLLQATGTVMTAAQRRAGLTQRRTRRMRKLGKAQRMQTERTPKQNLGRVRQARRSEFGSCQSL